MAGAVNVMRVSSNEIHALVMRHVFYQIDAGKKEVIRCVNFEKGSFSTFILKEEVLMLGNIENSLDCFDLLNNWWATMTVSSRSSLLTR